jgi:phosphoribosyl 1,2-cyclic phosphodiesterase
MTLRFLGTRGEIPIRSRRHWRHTATMVVSGHRRVVIDLGGDWSRSGRRLPADALVITHAHPDHVAAIRHGSPCPVYATADTWRQIGTWPIRTRRSLRAWMPCVIHGIQFEAVPVEHSVRAPAVGYRITADRRTIFYVSDIAALRQPERALAGVSMYIGDGSSLTRPILRRRNGRVIGHASIAAQLDWCRDAGVYRAIFTHCGSEIVRAGHRQARSRVKRLGRARGIDADLACDGDSIRVVATERRRRRAKAALGGGR